MPPSSTPHRKYPHWNFVVLAIVLGWLSVVFWDFCVMSNEGRGGMFSGVRATMVLAVIGAVFEWYRALLPACAIYALFLIAGLIIRRSRSRRTLAR